MLFSIMSRLTMTGLCWPVSCKVPYGAEKRHKKNLAEVSQENSNPKFGQGFPEEIEGNLPKR